MRVEELRAVGEGRVRVGLCNARGMESVACQWQEEGRGNPGDFRDGISIEPKIRREKDFWEKKWAGEYGGRREGKGGEGKGRKGRKGR